MITSLGRIELNRIAGKVIGCAYDVGKVLKHGYLEKAYENVLAYEIRKAGLEVKQQQRIEVKYKEIIAGEFVADLMVEFNG